MSINTGVNTSKLVSYAVLTPPKGVTVEKLVAYAVLLPASANPPVWPALTAPDGYLYVPYLFSWDLNPPATPPVTYTLISGSLPPGLSLGSVGASGGEITGTPTAVGTYPFVLRATNAFGTDDHSFSITINAATPISSSGSYVFLN